MKFGYMIGTSVALLALIGCSDQGSQLETLEADSYFATVRNLEQATDYTLLNTTWNTEVDTAIAIVTSTGEELSYQIIDGLAIFQGDIVLGDHEDIQQNGISALPTASGSKTAACNDTASCADYAWVGGVVPFAFSEGTSAVAQQVATDAMADWESVSAVRFTERTNEDDYVLFTAGSNRCTSLLGRSGGAQTLNYIGSTEDTCVRHAIGHVLLLEHEHSRSDRDSFVSIDWSNLDSNYWSQFRTNEIETDVGDYNYDSIMQINAYAYAVDKSKPVITSLDSSVSTEQLGTTNKISDGDIEKIDFSYGKASSSRKVTIAFGPDKDLLLTAIYSLNSNYESVFLWRDVSSRQEDQQWVEIEQDNGYYQYSLFDGKFCLDGSNKPYIGKETYLLKCTDDNKSQHWKKVKRYKKYALVNRSGEKYALDGGDDFPESEHTHRVTSGKYGTTDKDQLWFINDL